MAAAGGIKTGQSGLSRGQIIALTAVLAGGIALGWYGFKTAFGDGTTVTAPIQTVTVQRGTLSQTATTSGSVASQHSSKLTFPTAGRLSTVNVQNGQSVAVGDVIASLDVTTLQIALDQAKSTLNTAQAKYDALLAGQTPDVIEAAKAAIAQAQASQTSAVGQLGTAQTNKTTAQDSAATAANTIASAENQVATSQNGITTAHSQVVSAQNQLVQAQSTYQNLLDGPIPQDVAVAQASLDSAKTSLDTAQLNYDRLVSHTDIATRPETTALISASAAYQSALAGLANAQPQPANPFDIADQQLAVQTAQSQLNIAQANASTAQQAFFTAINSLAAVPPAQPALAQPPAAAGACTILAGRDACQITTEPSQPSASAVAAANAPLTAAQNAVTSAQNQINSTNSALINANQSYQKAVNDLQKLLNPSSTQNFGGLQAQVDAARQQLDVARRNFDSYLNLSDLAVRPEATALNTARSGYTSALAGYNLKVVPAKATDLANAQSAITSAQASVESALAAERNAQVSVSTAQVGVSTAQNAADSAAATAANSDTGISTAAGQVDSAKESVVSAQKKLDQLVAPPLPTDVRQSVEAVNQASLALQKSQNDFDGAVIRAPFAGIITAITANPGDQVSAATAIVSLVDPTHIEIDAQVDESTYGQLKVGMPVTVRLDALPGATLNGVISNIIPSGVTAQGVVTFPVVITLTNPSAIPPNGATASQIRITLQAKTNVLSVQGTYLYRNASGQQLVDVIKDGKRIPTIVQTGLATDTGTEISSGLQAGDQIAKPIKKATTASGSGVVGQGGVPGLGGGGGGAAPAGGGPPGR